jgi:two-component system, response regulator YesN
MVRRIDAAQRIFLRYAVTNTLLLLLPFLTAVIYHGVSIRALTRNVDTATVSQLQRSMTEIDKLYGDVRNMFFQLSNDYEVGYYLNNQGTFTGIELYNMKRISEKLFSYVLGNGLLSHCFLYLSKSGYLVHDSGFSTYESFYGPLFSCEGYDAARWRDEVLRSTGGEQLFPLLRITMGGQQSTSHVYRRSIGYGGYYLGSVVGTIDTKSLERFLGELPRRYGGWVYVEDAEGRVIASTSPASEPIGAAAAGGATTGVVRRGGETFRLYRMSSPVNGWTYTAVLSEATVLQPVGTVRNVALVLLGAGLAAGLGVAYLLAFTNARPWSRLSALILGEQGDTSRRPVSVYEQLERAIVSLSDSRRELEREVRSAEGMTRSYFLQNLLRGAYRSREAFEEERRLFRMEFGNRPHYVIVARLAALNAAREGPSWAPLRDGLLAASGRLTRAGEYLVSLSFDDVAIVKGCEAGAHREDAVAFIEGVRAELGPAHRGDFSFGVGRPASDPFLLVISHSEAAAAVSRVAAGSRDVWRFYEDAPAAATSYWYPLDTEENVIRAVRSGNEELLESLLAAIRKDNFVARTLSDADTRNLLVGLGGTAARLLDGLPEQAQALRVELERWRRTVPAPESLEELQEVLRSLVRAYGQAKRSHNSAMVESVTSYVAANFARHDLGLTLIADTLGISENYLSNFYKEQTGERLSAAIQRVRFEHAVRLLKSTADSVDSIAARCGYGEVSSFRRAFKRWNGLSPSELRAQESRRSKVDPPPATA